MVLKRKRKLNCSEGSLDLRKPIHINHNLWSAALTHICWW